MGHHSKTILSFASMLAAAVGVVMIFGHGYPRTPPDWHVWLSRGLIAFGVAGLATVMWLMLRRDRAPDFLRQMVRDPFECAGLYFLARFEDDHGISRLAIVFQNRYSRPCIPTIHLVPHEVRWRLEPLEFAADGGECGTFRRALHIPEDLRGREITFEIRGKNHYPDGHGRMLLFRDGLVVGQWSQAALNTITVAAAMTGHIHIAESAKVSMRLPNESHAFDSIEHPDAIESIWLPGADPAR